MPTWLPRTTPHRKHARKKPRQLCSASCRSRARPDPPCHTFPACNGHKYNKVEGADPLNRALVPLFNPLKQRWAEHFVWSDDFALLVGLTPTGCATVATQQMNQQKVNGHP